LRILPRTNDDVNEEWISDKTRHVVDGLRAQRLDQPYVRSGGRLRPASWSKAFAAIAANMARANPRRVGAIVGDLAAVEEIFALKDLMTRQSAPTSIVPIMVCITPTIMVRSITQPRNVPDDHHVNSLESHWSLFSVGSVSVRILDGLDLPLSSGLLYDRRALGECLAGGAELLARDDGAASH
jgi:hypothetical protein